ncbi:hypothetical protein ACJJTC_016115 [Scirpophaga incertulas]
MAGAASFKRLVFAVYVCIVNTRIIAQAQQTPVFRPDYKYFPDAQGWIKFHKIPTTWSEARLKCYHEGAVLASPTNERLFTAMRSFMLQRSSSAFIGMQSLTATGDYFSVEGIPLEAIQLQWAKGEPDNADDAERCLAMTREGTTADVRCGNVLPYMCYRKRTGKERITECGTHDKEYVMDAESGNCYKFHADCVSWWRAYMVCAAERGRLAVLASRAEAERMRTRFANYTTHCGERGLAHLGFINNVYWFTMDGKQLRESGYDQWAANEPNGVGENCGAFSRTGAGLADVQCERALPFLCQMPLAYDL